MIPHDDTRVYYCSEVQRQSDIIGGSRAEIRNARDFLLDCIADVHSYEEAMEIVDSWSTPKVIRWVARNWNGGLDGWAARGEMEYREHT